MYEISDFDAAQIASLWHSVMTWNDPGVAMYSVTSTGKVHSEEHRANLLAYIESCMPAAEKADADGDEPAGVDGLYSNVEDLEALAEWARNYKIGSSDDE